jgi:hypothetical protein
VSIKLRVVDGLCEVNASRLAQVVMARNQGVLGNGRGRWEGAPYI